MNKTVLITGGTGYIGSHAYIELFRVGYNIILTDTLFNNPYEIFPIFCQILGKVTNFKRINILDTTSLTDLFNKYTFSLVIHLVGFKSVNDSIYNPLLYYDNNINSTIYRY